MLEVFVDMDGVLCDFISAAMDCHGAKYDAETWPRKEWSIGKVLGITEDEFWQKIDERGSAFWSGLNPYPWKDDLLSLVKPVALLSSPSQHPSCHYGKRQWVDRHSQKTEMILCKSKHYIAAPHRLLVDDSDSNVEKWTRAGGLAILLPQPWNANHELSADPYGYAFDRFRDVLAETSPI